MPSRDAITSISRMITRPWQVWLRDLTTTATNAVALVQTVSLVGQAASIGTTSIPSIGLTTGLYRVTWYLRITTAATTSSSVAVSFGWTDTVSATLSGAAVTGNTVTTIQTGTGMFVVDAASPVTYTTSYSSAGATAMQYALSVTLEAVST